MTKEQLRNYLAIKAERKQLETLLEEIEGPLYDPKAQQLTGMPHAPSSTGSGSSQERLADRTMELRSYYTEKIADLTAEQLRIERAIDSLGPQMRKLLRHRYIEGLAWEAVCVAMSYSWRQTHRLHSEALELLKDKEELCREVV